MSGLLQLVCKCEKEPCSRCGKPIQPGTYAYFVYDMDASTYKTWHQHCDRK